MKINNRTKLFPPLTNKEYNDLKEDIKKNGLKVPIITFQNKIIDGVHRYKICTELKIKPIFQKWDEKGSLTAFIISLNLKRRHLTTSQKAMIAVEALPLCKKDAKDRLVESGKQYGKSHPKGMKIFSYPIDKGLSRDNAGALVGVSGVYVDDAKKIKDTSPELAAKVKKGEKTISQAKREIKRAEVKKKVAELPSDKFRVIYADPPWKYGNDGIINDDNYGHVGRHYPSMTISELCAMDIKGIVEDNAVLFLWVTSPLLFECEPVITAWGFKYKTSFVWDKIKHNFGHYNSVRHEFLLVCTRGSCVPDNKKLYDSVVSVERSKKHSEKPEQFRTIIDTLYPHGKRIELFARKKRKGWQSYGNEAK